MTTPATAVGIQRRQLGNELRKLREVAGLTQEQAAGSLGKAPNKISRVENGKVGISKTDLDELLRLYQASTKTRCGAGSWPKAPGADAPGPPRKPRCTSGRSGSARFATSSSPRRRSCRSARRSYPAIYRPRATPGLCSTAREVTRTTRPSRDIQVVPFDTLSYEPLRYAFTVLRFDHDSATDIVYIEMYDNGVYLDKPPEAVRSYVELQRRLQAIALGPVESRNFMVELAGQFAAKPD
jgi:transcriptional regulator with XRE-family HTH domain